MHIFSKYARLLCLLSTSLWAASPLGPDTDTFPGTYQADFAGPEPRISGRLPAPWSAVFQETRGTARLTFAPDPVRERPAFGLINLSGARGLALVTDPPVSVQPGARYRMEWEVLTTGETRGTLRMSGAVRRSVPLRDTRGTWQRLSETFTAETNALHLEFTSTGQGGNEGLYLSKFRLERLDTPEETPAPPRTPGTEHPLYATYRQSLDGLGSLSFLNSPDPDIIIRSVETGNLHEISNQPFGVYRRFEITRAGTTPQAVRLRIANRESIHPGETLMMVFMARGFKTPQPEEDGTAAEVQAVIRGPDDVPGPHNLKWHWSTLNQTQSLRERWTRHVVFARWEAHRELRPGEIHFEIHMAQKPQTIDIGGIALLSLKDADRDRFPVSVPAYMGQDPQASWRELADQRIQTHRTGIMTIRVTDAEGTPVPDAQVRVEMQRHAFQFATSVSLPTWHGRSPDGREFSEDDLRTYRTRSMAYFNRVELEDVYTWRTWEAAKDSETFQNMLTEMVTWYRERNISLDAGPLWIAHPDRLPQPPPSDIPDALRASITHRIQEADPALMDWTVIRETAGNHTLLDSQGVQVLADSFRTAQQARPDARLWLEEADIRHAIANGAFEKFQIPPNHGWLGWFEDQTVPLYGLKVQAQGGLLHNFGPEHWWRILDSVETRFDLPLRFTRLHVNYRNPTPEEQAYQENHFRDTLRTLFAHPSVEGISLAGFWSRAHPFPTAALWDAQWDPTPLGQIYLDLVYDAWWTQETGTTNAEGLYEIRGFQGTHQVQITTPDGQEIRRLLDLETDQAELLISLP